MSNENTNVTNDQENGKQKKVVMIVAGAGVEPVEVEWAEGLTVAAALEAANIELEKGETPVVGETLIEDPDTTLVESGQMIVIDDMPANG